MVHILGLLRKENLSFLWKTFPLYEHHLGHLLEVSYAFTLMHSIDYKQVAELLKIVLKSELFPECRRHGRLAKLVSILISNEPELVYTL